MILPNDLSVQELISFNNLVQSFTKSINNLEVLLHNSENNFDSEKFDKILGEYIESMKEASSFITNVNILMNRRGFHSFSESL